MSRSPSESSLVDVRGCGMQVPPPQAGVNGATGMLSGPVSVVLAGVVKSTWNFHSWRELLPKLRRKFGEPAGGRVAPSRSAGRTPPKLELSWKHCMVAAAPLSNAPRSRAQTFAPAKELPLLKMLKVM
jgi:hypothetical protein